MHIIELHSNESACRKSGRLGLDQVQGQHRPRVHSQLFVYITLHDAAGRILPNLVTPNISQTPVRKLITEGGDLLLL